MKIIAEVGSNFETLEDCRHSIRMAKACGADAVKFQLFTWEALYGVEFPNDVNTWAGCDTHANKILAHSLKQEWLPHLKQQADQCGIEFMCSAFSPELIDAVDPFVNIHKVASAEMCHVGMLRKLKQIGKPVYLSTGGHNFSDIKMALSYLEGVPVTLLHCVSAYPAQETNLKRMDALRKAFIRPVGFSDHSMSVDDIPWLAVKEFGAVVLEKHFKDKDYHSPDNAHSLNPDQFKKMVSYLKGEWTESYLGCENDMALKHNRRLIATKDIAVGEEFQEGQNYGSFRALSEDVHALPPYLSERVHGHTAKRPIPAGKGIGPGDF